MKNFNNLLIDYNIDTITENYHELERLETEREIVHLAEAGIALDSQITGIPIQELLDESLDITIVPYYESPNETTVEELNISNGNLEESFGYSPQSPSYRDYNNNDDHFDHFYGYSPQSPDYIAESNDDLTTEIECIDLTNDTNDTIYLD
jgi:hypothetical protein